MIQCSSSSLEGFLIDYGWSFKKVSRGVWRTGFTTEKRSYPVRILLDNHFLTLSVQPLLKIDIDLEAFPEAAAYLLELNHEASMVRLGVDEVGDITMSLNLINGSFSKDDFHLSLGLIGHYADTFYAEIAGFFAPASLKDTSSKPSN